MGIVKGFKVIANLLASRNNEVIMGITLIFMVLLLLTPNSIFIEIHSCRRFNCSRNGRLGIVQIVTDELSRIANAVFIE